MSGSATRTPPASCPLAPPLALLLSFTGLLACSAPRSAERAPAPEPTQVTQALPARPDPPTLRLIVVTDLHGVLEPCGCTTRQAGGVDRLATVVAETRRDQVPTLMLSAGDIFTSDELARRKERQQDIWQADALAALLSAMRLDVAAPGPADLMRARPQLRALKSDGRVALLGAGAQTDAEELLSESATRRVGSEQVAITSASVQAGATTAERERVSRLLDTEVTLLKKRGASLVIALVRDPDAGGARLLAAKTSADIVVHAGSALESHAVALGAGTLLVYAGQNGEAVLVVDLWHRQPSSHGWRLLDAASEITAASGDNAALPGYHPVDRSVAPDPQVRALLDRLFARVNAHNADHAAAPRRTAHGQSSYVGSDTCAACHTGAYFWWRQTPHGRAFQTLLARGRQLDLDCIACHVTGYEQPGGATVAQLEHLKGVGCESCHGPGSAHADNPRPPLRDVRRSVPETVCAQCHDREHSDAFAYSQARTALIVAAHGAARTSTTH